MAEDEAKLKGLILSGGTGSRLRPFTYSIAKQLLPLANKPVIFYVVEAMIDAGIRDIGIVVGSNGWQISEHLGDGSRYEARLTYIEQDAPRGLAHAVQCARPFLGDDDFAVFLGDNFLKGGIRSHVEAFRQSRAAGQILLKRMPNPQQFGVAELDGEGRLRRLIEKPVNPSSDLAVLGVYLLRKQFFEAAGKISPSARGELEITDALQAMLDGGHDLRGHVIDDDWVDTGGPEDLLRANRSVLDHQLPGGLEYLGSGSNASGNVRVESGATIIRTVIQGPAIVGRGSELRDSHIGPGTSIGPQVQALGSSIDNSIIMEGASIKGATITDSIIGRNAHVSAVGKAPNLRHLLLGDHGRIVLE